MAVSNNIWRISQSQQQSLPAANTCRLASPASQALGEYAANNGVMAHCCEP
jgi:hypothetical protein